MNKRKTQIIYSVVFFLFIAVRWKTVYIYIYIRYICIWNGLFTYFGALLCVVCIHQTIIKIPLNRFLNVKCANCLYKEIYWNFIDMSRESEKKQKKKYREQNETSTYITKDVKYDVYVNGKIFARKYWLVIDDFEFRILFCLLLWLLVAAETSKKKKQSHWNSVNSRLTLHHTSRDQLT